MVSTRKIVGKAKRKWKPSRKLSLAEHRQIRDWKQGKGARPDFVKSEKSEKRLQRVMAKRPRLGRRVQLNALSSVPETALEEKDLRNFFEKIEAERKGKLSSRRLKYLLAQARVLRKSILMSRELGGRKPTAYQVLAITALSKGLDSPELKKEAGRMGRWNKKKWGEKPWKGDAADLYKAISRNLPELIEELLYSNPKNVLDSLTISQKLGLKWNKASKKTINASMQLLETAGLIKKMPSKIEGIKSALGVWSHAAYKNPKVNYSNTLMELLETVSAGQSSTIKVFLPTQPHGKFDRTPRFELFYSQTMQYLNFLKKAGLVNLSKTSIGRDKNMPRIEFKGSLTAYGKKLWSEYKRTGSLPEPLRKLLLS